MPVPIRTKEEIERLRVVGRVVSQILDVVQMYVEPGVRTDELDVKCSEFMSKVKAQSMVLDYVDDVHNSPFPGVVCVTVNASVCHGEPNSYKLRSGDLLNVDVVVSKGGYVSDASRMYTVGKCSSKALHLIKSCYESLWLAASKVKPGVDIKEIGLTIQDYAAKRRLKVIKEFYGHGVGQRMHEAPLVPHYYCPMKRLTLEEGMVFTIEPILCYGSGRITTKQETWEVKTEDEALSAQWEHTLLVTDKGYEILTY
jgi:methionyl aminopeptidase